MPLPRSRGSGLGLGLGLGVLASFNISGFLAKFVQSFFNTSTDLVLADASARLNHSHLQTMHFGTQVSRYFLRLGQTLVHLFYGFVSLYQTVFSLVLDRYQLVLQTEPFNCDKIQCRNWIRREKMGRGRGDGKVEERQGRSKREGRGQKGKKRVLAPRCEILVPPLQCILYDISVLTKNLHEHVSPIDVQWFVSWVRGI